MKTITLTFYVYTKLLFLFLILLVFTPSLIATSLARSHYGEDISNHTYNTVFLLVLGVEVAAVMAVLS